MLISRSEPKERYYGRQKQGNRKKANTKHVSRV